MEHPEWEDAGPYSSIPHSWSWTEPRSTTAYAYGLLCRWTVVKPRAVQKAITESSREVRQGSIGTVVPVMRGTVVKFEYLGQRHPRPSEMKILAVPARFRR
ncbi:hypothetical protein GCM10027028_31560 [Streptomyces sundarbansensis]